MKTVIKRKIDVKTSRRQLLRKKEFNFVHFFKSMLKFFVTFMNGGVRYSCS